MLERKTLKQVESGLRSGAYKGRVHEHLKPLPEMTDAAYNDLRYCNYTIMRGSVNPRYTEFVNDIRVVLALLNAMPDMGHTVTNRMGIIRRYYCHDSKVDIFYRKARKGITVIRILDIN